jgi:hypothetical protein
MLCEQCGQHDALERDGSPVTFIFGTEVAGRLCRLCATQRQSIWDAELAELLGRDSDLNAQQLAQIPQRRTRAFVDLPQHKRSPLLIAAYCTIGVALISLVLGGGAFWVLSSIGLAVLLGFAELLVQLRRR